MESYVTNVEDLLFVEQKCSLNRNQCVDRSENLTKCWFCCCLFFVVVVFVDFF